MLDCSRDCYQQNIYISIEYPFFWKIDYRILIPDEIPSTRGESCEGADAAAGQAADRPRRLLLRYGRDTMGRNRRVIYLGEREATVGTRWGWIMEWFV